MASDSEEKRRSKRLDFKSTGVDECREVVSDEKIKMAPASEENKARRMHHGVFTSSARSFISKKIKMNKNGLEKKKRQPIKRTY